MNRILGVDIGGVIIDRMHDGSDTSFFSKRYLETPAVQDAFDTLAVLVERLFGPQVFIVSKCGEKTEQRTKEWLKHHGFYRKTGISPEHVTFCRERADKAPICAELGITHFIDDRLEVLGYMETVKYRYLFRPDAKEMTQFVEHLPQITKVVPSWAEVRREFRV